MNTLPSVQNLELKVQRVVKNVMGLFSPEDTFTYIEVLHTANILFGEKDHSPREWKEAEFVGELATNYIVDKFSK